MQFLPSVAQTMSLFQLVRRSRRTETPGLHTKAERPLACFYLRRGSTKEICMFMTLFVVLLVLWLLGFFAFHVAGGLIHLLLIIAVISLVMHFFRGRSAA